MRDIKRGYWVNIDNEEQFNKILAYGKTGSSDYHARVQKGDFRGQGKYKVLEYTQPCPRGCCRDFVRELITYSDFVYECKQEISELIDEIESSAGVAS